MCSFDAGTCGYQTAPNSMFSWSRVSGGNGQLTSEFSALLGQAMGLIGRMPTLRGRVEIVRALMRRDTSIGPHLWRFTSNGPGLELMMVMTNFEADWART